MAKALVAVVIFVTYQVRIALTSNRGKKFHLLCELEKRMK